MMIKMKTTFLNLSLFSQRIQKRVQFSSLAPQHYKVSLQLLDCLIFYFTESSKFRKSKKYSFSNNELKFKTIYLLRLSFIYGGLNQFNYLFAMADVSLDDLIKKDRDQAKAGKVNKKPQPKKFPPGKKFQGNNNQDRQNNQKDQEQDNRPFKKKFIKKQYEDNRNQPRNDREQRQENFKNKPPVKKEKPEEDKEDKQFRTLKVLGLSPEFTNEDLYKLFAAEGALEKCLIEQDNFGRSLTTAIVKYHSPDSARTAIQNYNRHKVMNCVLTVQPYKNVKK